MNMNITLIVVRGHKIILLYHSGKLLTEVSYALDWIYLIKIQNE